MNYLLHLIVYFEIYTIVAMSLNLLIGYGGLLQIAHAAYFGVGAYAGSLLMAKLGIGFLPALIFAGAIAAIFSLLVSLSAWRFSGDYFVMLSLTVQIALYSLMYNWVELTNGPYGLTGISKPVILSIKYATTGSIAVIYGSIVAILTGFIGVLKISSFGRSLQAMRDDPLAARSIGISVRKLKVEAFLIASAMVGMAGFMYASYVQYIDPSSFTLDESILMLSMVIVGGTGNILGPLVGAGVLIALPELLRFISLSGSNAASIRLLAYGLLLIIMMHWRPQGLAGKYRFE